jgi:dynein light intermediate chain 1
MLKLTITFPFYNFFIPDHTRLGHWILDGDSAHSHLLRFALTESNFTETTILLCVAMTTPWNIMDQLQNWASIIQDHIDKLTLSAEKTKQLQNESEYLVVPPNFFYLNKNL